VMMNSQGRNCGIVIPSESRGIPQRYLKGASLRSE
jgi:hypothetical protein